METIKYPIRELAWDTGFFGEKMGEVLITHEFNGFSELIWNRTIEQAKNEGYAFLLCQFDAKNQEFASVLANHGGVIGDLLLTFRLDLKTAAVPQIAQQYEISPAARTDLPEVLKIAEDSFQYSRFFQDSRFNHAKVARFYPQWISDSFLTSEKIWVIKVDGRITGFISWTADNEERKLIIRLIAVNADSRGRGLGRIMLTNLIKYGVKHDYHLIQVGTQVNNYGAIRLYEKNGFQIVNAKYRFHIWLDSFTAFNTNDNTIK